MDASFWIINAQKPQRGMKFRNQVLNQPYAMPDPKHTLRLRDGDAVRMVRRP